MSDVGDLLAGRYRLRRHLGSGAMGIVWEAVDERLERPVAVKRLLPQPGLDAAGAEQARQRAMREGRIAARLHHPNAVAVHDVTEHDGLPLLVMEYFPARGLAEVLAERGPLPPATAARIGTQVAAALAAAHEAGIVHRDVKPGNVLIGQDGTAKLVDFGIAHAGGDVTLTQTGVVAGTPAYLAPEVARGHPPTPASDVFSLGALLYAAVQGTPPFGESEENPLAVLYRVAAGTVTPPDRAGPLTPVLSAMLVTDPDHRPTARQIRDATRALAEGRRVPVLAGPDTDGHTQPIPAVPTAASGPPAPGPAPAGGSPNPGGTRLDLRPFAENANPAPPAHAEQPPPPPGAAPRRSRRGVFALTGAAVAMAALVGALLLASGGDDGDGTSAAPQVPTTTTTTPTTRPLTPADMRRVVADFYAALPDRPGAAWRHLGPELRAEGKQEFVARWADVRRVTVISPPRATGEDSVHVGVRLALRGGATVTEFHQYGIVRLDGTPLIRTDTVLHTESQAPPPKKKDDRKEDDKKKDEENKDGENKDGENKEDEGRGEREKNERKKDEGNRDGGNRGGD